MKYCSWAMKFGIIAQHHYLRHLRSEIREEKPVANFSSIRSSSVCCHLSFVKGKEEFVLEDGQRGTRNGYYDSLVLLSDLLRLLMI